MYFNLHYFSVISLSIGKDNNFTPKTPHLLTKNFFFTKIGQKGRHSFCPVFHHFQEKRKKGSVPFFRFRKKGTVLFFRFRKKGSVLFFRFRKKGSVPFFRFRKKGTVPFFRFRKKGSVPFFRFLGEGEVLVPFLCGSINGLGALFRRSRTCRRRCAAGAGSWGW